jgi:hypothetical protein
MKYSQLGFYNMETVTKILFVERVGSSGKSYLFSGDTGSNQGRNANYPGFVVVFSCSLCK